MKDYSGKEEEKTKIMEADVLLLLKMTSLAQRKRSDGSSTLVSVMSGSGVEI